MLFLSFNFQSTIQDLFNVDVGENDPARRMAEVVERDSRKERQKDETIVSDLVVLLMSLSMNLVNILRKI